MKTTASKKVTIPRTFTPLSRSALRYANSHGIKIFRPGTRQKRWIRALKSGGYTKATAHLCAIDGNGKEYHCCLGVACELIPDIKIKHSTSGCIDLRDIDRVNGDTSAFKVAYKNYDSHHAVLPARAVEYFSFITESGDLEGYWEAKFHDLLEDDKLPKCASLNEIKKYVKQFLRLSDVLRISDLTAMNDGEDVYLVDDIIKVKYSHSQIAEFVEAYPQAVFSKSI